MSLCGSHKRKGEIEITLRCLLQIGPKAESLQPPAALFQMTKKKQEHNLLAVTLITFFNTFVFGLVALPSSAQLSWCLHPSPEKTRVRWVKFCEAWRTTMINLFNQLTHPRSTLGADSRKGTLRRRLSVVWSKIKFSWNTAVPNLVAIYVGEHNACLFSLSSHFTRKVLCHNWDKKKVTWENSVLPCIWKHGRKRGGEPSRNRKSESII